MIPLCPQRDVASNLHVRRKRANDTPLQQNLTRTALPASLLAVPHVLVVVTKKRALKICFESEAERDGWEVALANYKMTAPTAGLSSVSEAPGTAGGAGAGGAAAATPAAPPATSTAAAPPASAAPELKAPMTFQQRAAAAANKVAEVATSVVEAASDVISDVTEPAGGPQGGAAPVAPAQSSAGTPVAPAATARAAGASAGSTSGTAPVAPAANAAPAAAAKPAPASAAAANPAPASATPTSSAPAQSAASAATPAAPTAGPGPVAATPASNAQSSGSASTNAAASKPGTTGAASGAAPRGRQRRRSSAATAALMKKNGPADSSPLLSRSERRRLETAQAQSQSTGASRAPAAPIPATSSSSAGRSSGGGGGGGGAAARPAGMTMNPLAERSRAQAPGGAAAPSTPTPAVTPRSAGTPQRRLRSKSSAADLIAAEMKRAAEANSIVTPSGCRRCCESMLTSTRGCLPQSLVHFLFRLLLHVVGPVALCIILILTEVPQQLLPDTVEVVHIGSAVIVGMLAILVTIILVEIFEVPLSALGLVAAPTVVEEEDDSMEIFPLSHLNKHDSLLTLLRCNYLLLWLAVLVVAPAYWVGSLRTHVLQELDQGSDISLSLSGCTLRLEQQLSAARTPTIQGAVSRTDGVIDVMRANDAPGGMNYISASVAPDSPVPCSLNLALPVDFDATVFISSNGTDLPLIVTAGDSLTVPLAKINVFGRNHLDVRLPRLTVDSLAVSGDRGEVILESFVGNATIDIGTWFDPLCQKPPLPDSCFTRGGDIYLTGRASDYPASSAMHVRAAQRQDVVCTVAAGLQVNEVELDGCTSVLGFLDANSTALLANNTDVLGGNGTCYRDVTMYSEASSGVLQPARFMDLSTTGGGIYVSIVEDESFPVEQYAVEQGEPFERAQLAVDPGAQRSLATLQAWVDEVQGTDAVVFIDMDVQNAGAWLFATREVFLQLQPHWLAAFSAGMLTPRHKRISARLVPGFCPISALNAATNGVGIKESGEIADMLLGLIVQDPTEQSRTYVVGKKSTDGVFRYLVNAIGSYSVVRVDITTNAILMAAIAISLALALIVGVGGAAVFVLVARAGREKFEEYLNQREKAAMLEKSRAEADEDGLEALQNVQESLPPQFGKAYGYFPLVNVAGLFASPKLQNSLKLFIRVHYDTDVDKPNVFVQMINKLLRKAPQKSSKFTNQIKLREFQDEYEAFCSENGYTVMDPTNEKTAAWLKKQFGIRIQDEVITVYRGMRALEAGEAPPEGITLDDFGGSATRFYMASGYKVSQVPTDFVPEREFRQGFFRFLEINRLDPETVIVENDIADSGVKVDRGKTRHMLIGLQKLTQPAQTGDDGEHVKGWWWIEGVIVFVQALMVLIPPLPIIAVALFSQTILVETTAVQEFLTLEDIVSRPWLLTERPLLPQNIGVISAFSGLFVLLGLIELLFHFGWWPDENLLSAFDTLLNGKALGKPEKAGGLALADAMHLLREQQYPIVARLIVENEEESSDSGSEGSSSDDDDGHIAAEPSGCAKCGHCCSRSWWCGPAGVCSCCTCCAPKLNVDTDVSKVLGALNEQAAEVQARLDEIRELPEFQIDSYEMLRTDDDCRAYLKNASLKTPVRFFRRRMTPRRVLYALRWLSATLFPVVLVMTVATWFGYIGLVGVWWVLGAIVNPAAFLPYAAAVVTFVTAMTAKAHQMNSLRKNAKKIVMERVSEFIQRTLDESPLAGKLDVNGGTMEALMQGDADAALAGLKKMGDDALAGAMAKVASTTGIDPAMQIKIASGDPDALAEVAADKLQMDPVLVMPIVAIARRDQRAIEASLSDLVEAMLAGNPHAKSAGKLANGMLRMVSCDESQRIVNLQRMLRDSAQLFGLGKIDPALVTTAVTAVMNRDASAAQDVLRLVVGLSDDIPEDAVDLVVRMVELRAKPVAEVLTDEQLHYAVIGLLRNLVPAAMTPQVVQLLVGLSAVTRGDANSFTRAFSKATGLPRQLLDAIVKLGRGGGDAKALREAGVSLSGALGLDDTISCIVPAMFAMLMDSDVDYVACARDAASEVAAALATPASRVASGRGAAPPDVLLQEVASLTTRLNSVQKKLLVSGFEPRDMEMKVEVIEEMFDYFSKIPAGARSALGLWMRAMFKDHGAARDFLESRFRRQVRARPAAAHCLILLQQCVAEHADDDTASFVDAIRAELDPSIEPAICKRYHTLQTWTTEHRTIVKGKPVMPAPVLGIDLQGTGIASAITARRGSLLGRSALTLPTLETVAHAAVGGHWQAISAVSVILAEQLRLTEEQVMDVESIMYLSINSTAHVRWSFDTSADSAGIPRTLEEDQADPEYIAQILPVEMVQRVARFVGLAGNVAPVQLALGLLFGPVESMLAEQSLLDVGLPPPLVAKFRSIMLKGTRQRDRAEKSLDVFFRDVVGVDNLAPFVRKLRSVARLILGGKTMPDGSPVPFSYTMDLVGDLFGSLRKVDGVPTQVLTVINGIFDMLSSISNLDQQDFRESIEGLLEALELDVEIPAALEVVADLVGRLSNVFPLITNDPEKKSRAITRDLGTMVLRLAIDKDGSVPSRLLSVDGSPPSGADGAAAVMMIIDMLTARFGCSGLGKTKSAAVIEGRRDILGKLLWTLGLHEPAGKFLPGTGTSYMLLFLAAKARDRSGFKEAFLDLCEKMAIREGPALFAIRRGDAKRMDLILDFAIAVDAPARVAQTLVGIATANTPLLDSAAPTVAKALGIAGGAPILVGLVKAIHQRSKDKDELQPLATAAGLHVSMLSALVASASPQQFIEVIENSDFADYIGLPPRTIPVIKEVAQLTHGNMRTLTRLADDRANVALLTACVKAAKARQLQNLLAPLRRLATALVDHVQRLEGTVIDFDDLAPALVQDAAVFVVDLSIKLNIDVKELTAAILNVLHAEFTGVYRSTAGTKLVEQWTASKQEKKVVALDVVFVQSLADEMSHGDPEAERLHKIKRVRDWPRAAALNLRRSQSAVAAGADGGAGESKGEEDALVETSESESDEEDLMDGVGRDPALVQLQERKRRKREAKAKTDTVVLTTKHTLFLKNWLGVLRIAACAGTRIDELPWLFEHESDTPLDPIRRFALVFISTPFRTDDGATEPRETVDGVDVMSARAREACAQAEADGFALEFVEWMTEWESNGRIAGEMALSLLAEEIIEGLFLSPQQANAMEVVMLLNKTLCRAAFDEDLLVKLMGGPKMISVARALHALSHFEPHDRDNIGNDALEDLENLAHKLRIPPSSLIMLVQASLGQTRAIDQMAIENLHMKADHARLFMAPVVPSDEQHFPGEPEKALQRELLLAAASGDHDRLVSLGSYLFLDDAEAFESDDESDSDDEDGPPETPTPRLASPRALSPDDIDLGDGEPTSSLHAPLAIFVRRTRRRLRRKGVSADAADEVVAELRPMARRLAQLVAIFSGDDRDTREWTPLFLHGDLPDFLDILGLERLVEPLRGIMNLAMGNLDGMLQVLPALAAGLAGEGGSGGMPIDVVESLVHFSLPIATAAAGMKIDMASLERATAESMRRGLAAFVDPLVRSFPLELSGKCRDVISVIMKLPLGRPVLSMDSSALADVLKAVTPLLPEFVQGLASLIEGLAKLAVSPTLKIEYASITGFIATIETEAQKRFPQLPDKLLTLLSQLLFGTLEMETLKTLRVQGVQLPPDLVAVIFETIDLAETVKQWTKIKGAHPLQQQSGEAGKPKQFPGITGLFCRLAGLPADIPLPSGFTPKEAINAMLSMLSGDALGGLAGFLRVDRSLFTQLEDELEEVVAAGADVVAALAESDPGAAAEQKAAPATPRRETPESRPKGFMDRMGLSSSASKAAEAAKAGATRAVHAGTSRALAAADGTAAHGFATQVKSRVRNRIKDPRMDLVARLSGILMRGSLSELRSALPSLVKSAVQVLFAGDAKLQRRITAVLDMAQAAVKMAELSAKKGGDKLKATKLREGVEDQVTQALDALLPKELGKVQTMFEALFALQRGDFQALAPLATRFGGLDPEKVDKVVELVQKLSSMVGANASADALPGEGDNDALRKMFDEFDADGSGNVSAPHCVSARVLFCAHQHSCYAFAPL